MVGSIKGDLAASRAGSTFSSNTDKNLWLQSNCIEDRTANIQVHEIYRYLLIFQVFPCWVSEIAILLCTSTNQQKPKIEHWFL